MTTIIEKTLQAIKWRCDRDSPEMIESKGYKRDYMGFDSVSSKELDQICDGANALFESLKDPRRIGWSMGELIPWRIRQDKTDEVAEKAG